MVAIDFRCRLRREEQMERRVSSSDLHCAPCTVRTLLNLAPADLAVRLQKSGTLFLQLPARIEPALILFVGTLLRLFCIYYFFTYLRLLYFNFSRGKKGSPYSIAERRVPELIPVLGSQRAGDLSHIPGGRLPLLSARPAVTPATLKRAATDFAAW